MNQAHRTHTHTHTHTETRDTANTHQAHRATHLAHRRTHQAQPMQYTPRGEGRGNSGGRAGSDGAEPPPSGSLTAFGPPPLTPMSSAATPRGCKSLKPPSARRTKAIHTEGGSSWTARRCPEDASKARQAHRARTRHNATHKQTRTHQAHRATHQAHRATHQARSAARQAHRATHQAHGKHARQENRAAHQAHRATRQAHRKHPPGTPRNSPGTQQTHQARRTTLGTPRARRAK